MKIKRILIVYCALLVAVLMFGCSDNSEEVGTVVDGYTVIGDINLEQLQLPEVGEEIVNITTNKGTIKMRLFEKIAPEIVGYIKELISEDFYDGLLFSRVFDDFVIQVETAIDETEEDEYVLEYHDDYRHFNGAVGLARYNERGSSSSFYIIANSGLEEDYVEGMKEFEGTMYSKEIIDIYAKIGGVPRLDKQYTVFGQVFYGLDTVMDINKLPLIEGTSMPTEPVIVEKMELEIYEGK